MPRLNVMSGIKPKIDLIVPEGLVCGIDEAGRGPLAGPVVAAAVILYEGFRQLDAAGRYDAPDIEAGEMARLIKLWSSK